MVLVHLQPVVIVIVCHAIATDGGVGGVLDHGLCLAWIHVSVSVLLGWWSGSHSIVFGSIRWCVWSFRPSSPLRLPHLKCLLPDILLPEDRYLDMFDSESDLSGDNSDDELVEVFY